MSRLLSALAVEHARLTTRTLELLEELDAREAEDLLEQWAELMALPSPCFPEAQSGRALAFAVHRELTVDGGQTIERFLQRAAGLGYTQAVITELDAARTGVLRMGDRLRGPHYVHAWQIEAQGAPTDLFRAGVGRCGQRLQTRYQFDLECVMQSEKPAHTVILFLYDGE